MIREDISGGGRRFKVKKDVDFNGAMWISVNKIFNER